MLLQLVAGRLDTGAFDQGSVCIYCYELELGIFDPLDCFYKGLYPTHRRHKLWNNLSQVALNAVLWELILGIKVASLLQEGQFERAFQLGV